MLSTRGEGGEWSGGVGERRSVGGSFSRDDFFLWHILTVHVIDHVIRSLLVTKWFGAAVVVVVAAAAAAAAPGAAAVIDGVIDFLV